MSEKRLRVFPCVAGIIAAGIFIVACAGTGALQKKGYTPGIYTGTGRGYRGPVEVSVQVSPTGIESVEILRHEERYPGAAALEELLETALESGTADLDAVSGATFSSAGFIEAVEEALEKAHVR